MATSLKKTHAQMERELDRSRPERITSGEIVKKSKWPESPVSVRLSAPLLEALDHMAQQQHRTRGNLIQHILWEYVHTNGK
jgi:hypothetical protein